MTNAQTNDVWEDCPVPPHPGRNAFFFGTDKNSALTVYALVLEQGLKHEWREGTLFVKRTQGG